jgi:oligosaccharide repeat unit polymerase
MLKHHITAGPPPDMTVSTGVILGGLMLTSLLLPSESAMDVYFCAAIGVGLSLALATGIEGRAGVRKLIRVDILMLWVLYGLTFSEFFVPQPSVNDLISPADAVNGTNAVLVAFGGMSLGRHLVRWGGPPASSALIHLGPNNVFFLFLLATLLGYLHVFLAVNFDLFEALRQMSLPRFSQSWGRGKYGDAYALLYEIGALVYLIPPIAGLIYARSKEYKLIFKIVVTITFLFTLYYGFASGTRNVFVTYVVTFAGVYFVAKHRFNLRQALLLGGPMLVGLLLATIYMLAFRQVGLSNFSVTEQNSTSFFVDYNIVNVSHLTRMFPSLYEYLGLEVPLNALIRPIPRVLWPGKPEGLSVTIESALGASPGMTLSCTFVGEAYMAGGLVAVLLISLFFGAGAALWNRVGANTNHFAQLLFVSGFLCVTLAMRSMLSMVPFMLPTLALWIFGKVWLPRSHVRRAPRPGVSYE